MTMKREQRLLLVRNGIALAILVAAVGVLAAPNVLRGHLFEVMIGLVAVRYVAEVRRLWRPYYNVPVSRLATDRLEAARQEKPPLFTPLESASTLTMLIAIVYHTLY
jgi:hypothetical protein